MSLETNARKTMSQQNVIVALIVALLIGWVVGFVVGGMDDDVSTNTVSVTSEEDSTTHTAMHETFEVEATVAPSVKVLADADEVGGWNISLVTENFEFTPQDVNGEDIVGTGHAHLYVDGEKIGRLYSNHYHLPPLGDGDHEIRVTLNTNGHKEYTVAGGAIKGKIDVTEMAHSDEADHDESVPHSHN